MPSGCEGGENMWSMKTVRINKRKPDTSKTYNYLNHEYDGLGEKLNALFKEAEGVPVNSIHGRQVYPKIRKVVERRIEILNSLARGDYKDR